MVVTALLAVYRNGSVIASNVGGCVVENATTGFWSSRSPDVRLWESPKGNVLLEKNQHLGRAVVFVFSGRDVNGRIRTWRLSVEQEF
jgi:hypothetical protein